MVLAKVMPRIVVSAWYGMFSVSVMYSILPPPVPSISVCSGELPWLFRSIVSRHFMTGKSVGVVTKIAIFSVYTTTTVFRARFPIRIPCSFWSKMRSNGSTHKAKSSMLMGHPCLTEL